MFTLRRSRSISSARGSSRWHCAGSPAGSACCDTLGIRPDLTGQGLGARFIEAGLQYATEEWSPKRFRLWVAWWNERALRAYRRAGFEEVSDPEEKRRFVEMERPA